MKCELEGLIKVDDILLSEEVEVKISKSRARKIYAAPCCLLYIDLAECIMHFSFFFSKMINLFCSNFVTELIERHTS